MAFCTSTEVETIVETNMTAGDVGDLIDISDAEIEKRTGTTYGRPLSCPHVFAHLCSREVPLMRPMISEKRQKVPSFHLSRRSVVRSTGGEENRESTAVTARKGRHLSSLARVAGPDTTGSTSSVAHPKKPARRAETACTGRSSEGLKYVIKALDMIIFSAVLLCLLIFLSSCRGKTRSVQMQKRRLLCLVPATLDAIQTKGTVDHIFYRDLEGYFEHVLTVHFPAERDRMVKLSERHTVLEFSKQRLAALRTLPRINMLASGAHVLISLFHTIRREKISVIKAHDPYIQGLTAFFLSRATGIPFLVQIVSNYDLTWKSTGASAYPVLKFRPIEKMMERCVFRHADLVMAVSENNRDFAIRNGTPLSKAITVPSSGLPSKMHFEGLHVRRNLRSELGLQNRRIIAYFGRLSPEKYPEDVVRCAMKVVGSRSDVVFLLVGDGPMRTGLERLVSSVGLTNHVYILGFQPQERVRDLMYTADVILSPLTQVALIEAALSGTPVVAYDIEWHHELIKNERTGLLVPYRDYVEMAQAVLWLLGHPEEARRLGERAREAALRQYDPKKMLRKEIDCFEGVLTNGREQSTWTSRESTHHVVQ